MRCLDEFTNSIVSGSASEPGNSQHVVFATSKESVVQITSKTTGVSSPSNQPLSNSTKLGSGFVYDRILSTMVM